MKLKSVLFVSTATICLLGSQSLAWAQEKAGGLEEIVVTAEKRSENVQDTASAVTAITSDSLTENAVFNTDALENLIPSANFKQSASASMLFIRGVGNNVSAPAIDPGVAYNVNGVYVSREGTGSNGILYDLQRIEVLPGPQGTLWGRNAAGGAIDVLTNQPTTQFGGNILVDVGNYGAVHTTGAINVPVDDKLQVRGAFNIVEHDGYLTNGANDADSQAGRVTVAIEPIDDLKIVAYGSYSHDGGIGSAGVNKPYVNTANPWYADNNAGAPLSNAGLFLDVTNWSAGAQLDYNFDGMTLTYIPSYQFINVNTVLWAQAYVGGQEEEHQYSNELRLASDNTGPLKWVAGLFDYDLYQHFQQTVNGPLSLNLQHLQERSYAGFGQVTYSLTDKFRVTAGGRYSRDQKLAHGQAIFGGKLTYFNADGNWGHADYKVGIEADVLERSMVYATVQTGYVPGAYSNAPNSPAFNNLISPEKLISYTAGIKNRFFNNKLEINDEIFYYNYKNYQVTARNNFLGVTTVQSANKVGIYGDQLDVKYRATPSDIFHVDVGILHARYDDFVAVGVNYSGQQAVDSPDLTAGAGYDHVFDFTDGSTVTTSINTHFESGHWANFLHSPGLHQAAYTKTNLTATYNTADEKWGFSVYVDNVENAAVLANGSGSAAPVSNVFLEAPRTYGVRGTYSF